MVDIELHLGDCRDVLRDIPDNSVDLVFFDPPYGLNIAAWDVSMNAARQAADMVFTKLRDGGSLYATCSPHILEEMLSLWPYRRIIAWGKPNLPLRKTLNEWEWSTEYVIWVTRGEPKTFNKPRGENGRDYWRIAVENGFLRLDNYDHPARKPLALLRRIVGASTDLGDAVLDPFMGSGTTGVACVQTGRSFIGIEIDETYYRIAERRIAEAQMQPALL